MIMPPARYFYEMFWRKPRSPLLKVGDTVVHRGSGYKYTGIEKIRRRYMGVMDSIQNVTTIKRHGMSTSTKKIFGYPVFLLLIEMC